MLTQNSTQFKIEMMKRRAVKKANQIFRVRVSFGSFLLSPFAVYILVSIFHKHIEMKFNGPLQSRRIQQNTISAANQRIFLMLKFCVHFEYILIRLPSEVFVSFLRFKH